MTAPRDIYRVAQLLMPGKGKDDSARFRSVISRAYYAVFHYVGQRLNIADYHKPGNAHARLYEALMMVPPATADKDISRARTHFLSLKEARERADYRLSEMVSRLDADLALQRAKEVLETPP